VIGIVGVSMLASLPDFVEPAIHPNHRQFFHGVVFAAALGAGVYQTYQWGPETPMQEFLRAAIMIGGTAYLLHLAADACTRKSVPFVGKF